MPLTTASQKPLEASEFNILGTVYIGNFPAWELLQVSNIVSFELLVNGTSS
jgi:hypothetical protein